MLPVVAIPRKGSMKPECITQSRSIEEEGRQRGGVMRNIDTLSPHTCILLNYRYQDIVQHQVVGHLCFVNVFGHYALPRGRRSSKYNSQPSLFVATRSEA